MNNTIEIYDCETCGMSFERKVKTGRKKRFCTSKCGDKSRAKRRKNKHKLICKQCSKEFGSPNEDAEFCSNSCSARFGNTNVQSYKKRRNCKRCDKEFTGLSFSEYCSDNCRYEDRECPECNNSFKVPFGAKYKKIFCSNSCRNRNNAKHIYFCENCGKEFIGGKYKGNKFCSRKCFYERLGYKEHGVKRLSYLSDASSILRAKRYGVKYEKIDVLEVFLRDFWLCGICKKRVDSNLVYPDPMSASLDHIIPLSKGGTHTVENVQCSHLTCNVKKSNFIKEGGVWQAEAESL